MESNKKYVIGLDFGTDSCRALVVDTYTGREMATGVSFYPRWKAGLYCDAHNNRYRQHPLDYIESMIEAVHIALSDLKEEEIASICGLCFDTTGSTPALTDKAGMPLALCPEFAEEPDAMFILWKDHTAVREAEQINALINKRNLDYLLYEGGTYSSEWVWSKVLHIINTNVAIKDAAYAWVEHCDWMTGLVTGNTIPEQKAWDSYVMYDERTQFNLQGNPMALLMYLPGYVNTHEGVYSHVRYDKVARKRLIEMPATFEFDNGVAVVITEAAIRDYAGMYLVKEKGGLVGKLSPKLGQEKIKVETDSFPHRTPWRVISVADRVGGLLETNILTSLNEPCRIEDTSWIKPCRTTFTWWNGNVVPDSTFSPGNNFDTNKYYIDFAARNGLDAHGIYGYAETPWYYDDNFNFGWAGPNADVTKPIPCLNMPRIVEYARSKGVGIHLWVHWRPLYDKLEEAFALYEGWGVKGLMVDFMDRNDQEMIRIQEEILECAARHRLFIQFHGSSKPSGLVRTYPNEFTREGTLNYEVCKWDTLVNADHDIAIPFTRMLAGATDYHLGGFRALPRSEFKIQYVNPHVMSTRCHMLAMYVVLENHLTSLCDTPKAYEGQPGFEVLRTVPGTWDEIRVPLAKMNEHVTVARRSGSDWWVGSLNNGAERNLKLELDFLSEGDYQATIYTDAEDVDRNPNHLDRQVRKVTRKDIIELNLAKDGGALLHIRRL